MDAKTPEDLAAQLVRITYNRSKCRDRHERKLRQFGPGDDDPSDEQDRDEREIEALKWNAIDEVVEELDPKSKQYEIVRMWLAGEARTQEDIAARVGVDQASVSRWLGRFKASVRRRFAEES